MVLGGIDLCQGLAYYVSLDAVLGRRRRAKVTVWSKGW